MRNPSRKHPVRNPLLLLVGMALVIAGCACNPATNTTSEPLAPGGTFKARITKEDTAGPIQKGGKIAFGLNAETDGWNPAFNRWASSGYIVGFSMIEPLAAYDENLDPQPFLAESFSPNADFTEWTIKLRKGVTFHDGAPVDAEAVKKSFETFKRSGLTGEVFSFAQIFDPIDPLTLLVKMDRSWSTFPHVLTAQSGAIAAPSMLDNPEGNRKPVGSGPFVFENWVTGKSINVKKNQSYWRKGYPHLDNIEFQVLADIQSRGQALESGSVDIIETNDPGQIITFTEKAREDRFQIFTDEQGDGDKIFVGLNVTKEPFDDPLARQAVAYAGNVAELSAQAYSGIFPPAYGPFSEHSPFFVDLGERYPKYNPEKARQLAQEYEAKHGKPLEFTANIIPVPEVQQVAQVLQAQLAEVGIIVNLASMEQLTLIVRALSGDFQATGFILFGSPHLDREYVFIASPAKPNGESSLNFTRIGLAPNGQPNDDNKRIVDAMNEARKTLDRQKQIEQYRIVQEEMAKNLNFLFLVRQTRAVVYSNKVHGALGYRLPDASGGDGKPGMLTPNTWAFNLWVSQ